MRAPSTHPRPPPPDGDAAATGRSPGKQPTLLGRISSSRLVRRFASGAFWSVTGYAASRALTLVGSILVARRLGVTAFGEYNLVLVTVGLFQNVAGFGLVSTSTKFLSGSYKTDPLAAGHVVALSRLVAGTTGWAAMVAAAIGTPWIATHVLGAPELEGAIRIGAVLLLFGPAFGVQLGILTGLERFRVVAGVSTLAALASIPLLVVGAAVAGTLGCVVAQVAWFALSTALHAWAARRALRAAGIAPRYRGAFREWRILFSYSLPATLSNILLGAVYWGTSAILVHQPGGFREIGLFSAANQWRNGIVLVTTAAGSALLPLFSDLHDNGGARTLHRAFWLSFAASAIACVLGAGGIALAAPAIMRAYGSEFAGATTVLVLLAASGALAAPLSIAGHAIAGAGRMWLSFALSLVWGTTLLVLVYALRTRGAYGASLAHFWAYVVYLALSVTSAAAVLHGRVSAEAAPPARDTPPAGASAGASPG